MSKTVTIGKVALTPKGEYSSTAMYEELDVVRYEGSSYVVNKPCSGITPVEGEYYTLMAEKGTKGDPGQDGYTPVKGVDYFDGAPGKDATLEGGSTGQIPYRKDDGSVGWMDPPTGDVASFNGRTGPVVPAAGDYTSEMVGTLSAEKINDLCQTKSNKNMCRNWDLRKPVNSQGRSTYDPSHGWRRTIDIWEATSTRVDVMNGYVKITSVPDVDKWSRFTQMTNFDLVPGNTYTLTIHARVISVDGTVFLRFCDKEFGCIANSTGKSIGSFSLYETNDFDTMSVTITPDGSKVYDHFGFEIIANGPQETGKIGRAHV